MKVMKVMEKSVLISIRPEWVSLILLGKKTVEVRKNCPHLKVPFKCYIYCSKANKGWIHLGTGERMDGMVVAEFMCDEVHKSFLSNSAFMQESDDVQELLDRACLKYAGAYRYLGSGRVFYGWNISDLVQYKRPRSLKEFGIKRAPMSWQYVDEG